MLIDQFLLNNIWVIIAGVLVFSMVVAVGFLEIGELGESLNRSLLKTLLIFGTSLFVMAIIGFNTAFAPTVYGVIGNPFYKEGFFLGFFTSNQSSFINSVWWSSSTQYFATGLSAGTYFFFETACAAVALALVGVVILRKVKLSAFFLFSIAYFTIIWNLPASWVWNPTGWLYKLGMRDFAGGLVIHASAGAAGLAIMYRIWHEEKKRGLKISNQQPIKVNGGWLALSILILLIGWFGFNAGSTLAFNGASVMAAVTTFLSGAAAMLSAMGVKYAEAKKNPGILYATNGLLMGLIVVTPLAGFVSPGSAIILGLIGGALFVGGEKLFSSFKWFSDPVGLMPQHFLGGIFGVSMIAFFTQNVFASASGNSNLPNGLLFGGGISAVHQLGIEEIGIVVSLLAVFLISYLIISIIGLALHGITEDSEYPVETKKGVIPSGAK